MQNLKKAGKSRLASVGFCGLSDIFPMLTLALNKFPSL
jgi:hypothetical protein